MFYVEIDCLVLVWRLLVWTIQIDSFSVIKISKINDCYFLSSSFYRTGSQNCKRMKSYCKHHRFLYCSCAFTSDPAYMFDRDELNCPYKKRNH